MHFIEQVSLRAALLLTTLSAWAGAQVQGPASALASGLSLDDQDPNLYSEVIVLKPPQSQSVPPAPAPIPANPTDPVYNLSMMFSAEVLNFLEIDAHSTGMAIIPAPDQNGVPGLQQQGSWMGVTVSLSDDVQGTQGGLVEAQRLASGAVGADLFGHYLENSQGLSSWVRGQSFLEQTQEDMGFAASAAIELDALDFAIGVEHFAGSTEPRIVFGDSLEYFFSISEDSAAQLNLHLSVPFAEDRSGQPFGADPVTIYRINWTNNAWSSDITAWRTASELGLDPEVDNLDALDVASHGNPLNDTIVFSTQPADNRSQLLIQEGHFPFLPLSGEDDNGNPYWVASRLDIDNDEDIDGVCITEPHMGLTASHFAHPVGEPAGNLTLGLSVTRQEVGRTDSGTPPVDTLEFQVTGAPGGIPTSGLVLILGAEDRGGGPLQWFVLASGFRPATTQSFGLSMPNFGQGIPAEDLLVQAVQYVSSDIGLLNSWISAIDIE